MERAATRKWSILGIILLVLATLVMGWFVGRYIPGTPKVSEGDTMSGMYPGIYSWVKAQETVETAFGDSRMIEGVTQGLKFCGIEPFYGVTGEQAADEEREGIEGYIDDHGSFELAVGEVKVVSGEMKELVVPYYIYKNSFKDDRAFEDIDLSRFWLEVDDYDQAIRYRFRLA